MTDRASLSCYCAAAGRLFLAVGGALALGLSALAIEPLGMQGLGWPSTGDEQGKRLSLFVGASCGTDSNPRRAEDPAEVQEETLTEYLVGVAIVGGNDHRRYDLAYQGRLDDFLGDAPDFQEHCMLLGLGTYSERFHIGVRGKLALLADPSDPDLVALGAGDLVNRTLTAVAPDMSINFGRTEVSVGYSVASTDFGGDFGWLDMSETATSGELRWWRGEGLQLFARGESGRVERKESIYPSFDYSRFYAGWRSETPRRSGLEFGLGVQTLSGFEGATAEDRHELVFATLRTTRVLSEGRASLDLACTRTSEPSASATYKDVLAAQVRYRRQSGRRFSWSIGMLVDQSQMTEPYPSTPEDSLRLTGELQLALEIGSPSRTHGRLYATAAYESRSANDSQFDYERLRLLAGLALVH